jgi:acetyl-CoA carboxylase biotin carboxylase subunit
VPAFLFKEKKMIKKILVANRGEIALRVMKTCKRMGILTVAVYSEADAHAPFVAFADEAVCIGPAPSSQSYLVISHIIQAALQTGADGIHPGYGFLSENAVFARAVKDAGIVFIGPSPEAIEMMGSKLGAKAAVKKFGVPFVPGTEEAISDISEALRIGKNIGFPILIKASAGGGGKGMRVVESEFEFEEGLNRAVSEAQSAFGDGSVFMEKYLRNAKHIEIQVLSDGHGNHLYLHERECSVQRRHQKVVEEAPSPVLTDDLRAAMGKCATDVARACNYMGAGTVEFIFNEGEFYFLEMNTRLQVEHPVTEMITGLDLVEWQIRIASGEVLPFRQEEIPMKGHAIQVRVYAEDPTNNFLPDIGRLKVYRAPEGEGIRVDDGYREGMEVPIYYDPMLAKLIVHGANREQAIEGMLSAIAAYEIHGVETTLDFCRFVLEHPSFRDGSFTTQFVHLFFTSASLSDIPEEIAKLGAVLSAQLNHEANVLNHAYDETKPLNPWAVKRV